MTDKPGTEIATTGTDISTGANWQDWGPPSKDRNELGEAVFEGSSVALAEDGLILLPTPSEWHREGQSGGTYDDFRAAVARANDMLVAAETIIATR